MAIPQVQTVHKLISFVSFVFAALMLDVNVILMNSAIADQLIRPVRTKDVTAAFGQEHCLPLSKLLRRIVVRHGKVCCNKHIK